MFKRSFPGSRDRVEKTKVSKMRSRDTAKARLREALNSPATTETSPSIGGTSPALNSTIFNIVVGKDQRVFAAHEDVLSQGSFFAEECRKQYFSDRPTITLPDESPEVFSCVLLYLYKGDYHPRLLHNERRNTWLLEDTSNAAPDLTMSPKSDRSSSTFGKAFTGFDTTTVWLDSVGDYILRDTAIYCSALRYGLPELQRLALRKQGLQSCIDVGTILRSARFAYANTPKSDHRLRAHYIALIIRSRKTFKRSGNMQREMEEGGTQFFFDLFVAMCNHIDDVTVMSASSSPLIGK